jgi:hypothetical protein
VDAGPVKRGGFAAGELNALNCGVVAVDRPNGVVGQHIDGIEHGVDLRAPIAYGAQGYVILIERAVVFCVDHRCVNLDNIAVHERRRCDGRARRCECLPGPDLVGHGGGGRRHEQYG